MALYLHSENNRYYKKHNIILRPGYMAKWIEVLYLAPLMKSGEFIPRVIRRNLA